MTTPTTPTDTTAAASTGTGAGGTRRPLVLVGIDGSEESEKALRWAIALAELNGGELKVVTTWHEPTPYGAAAGWGAYLPADWDPRQDAEKAATEVIDKVCGAHRPPWMVVETVQGHPAHVLTTYSTEATVLVVGSRGHGGFAGLLLGSVSAYCAEHASCPVVVVHGDQLPR